MNAFRRYVTASLLAALAASLLLPGCSDSDKDKGAARPARPSRPAAAPAAAEIEQAPVAEAPPAPLAMAMELGAPDVFAGEPVPVRVYVQSPLAESKADGKQPTDWPVVNKDWPAAVRFTLYRLDGEKRQPAAGSLEWGKLLKAVADPDAVAGGNPVREWEIPASAALAEGQYVLAAAWKPDGQVDARWLAGSQVSAELTFEVRTPATPQDKAAHTEALALAAYRARQFADARRLAAEAVKTDPSSTSPQRIRLLLAQADACLAMDDFAAGAALYRNILKTMPLNPNMAAKLTGDLKTLEGLIVKMKARGQAAAPPAP